MVKVNKQGLEMKRDKYGQMTIAELESALATIDSFRRDAKDAVKCVREAIKKGATDEADCYVGEVSHAIAWMAANANSKTNKAEKYFREYYAAVAVLRAGGDV